MQTRCNGYIDFYFGSSRTLEKPFFCGYLCDAFETIKLTKQKKRLLSQVDQITDRKCKKGQSEESEDTP